MGTLNEEMRRVVEEQRLGYAATVCPDGTPNLSPKGTTAVWDADRLIFADIRSPGTVENLRWNPTIEVNVVDPISRKGTRFKGTGMVLTEGDLFDEALEFYRERGVVNEIRAVVLVEVERVLSLTSPAYDLGATEEEVRERWERHHEALRKGEQGSTPRASDLLRLFGTAGGRRSRRLTGGDPRRSSDGGTTSPNAGKRWRRGKRQRDEGDDRRTA